MKIALTVAGTDGSGGAGIQADLKTFASLGVYGASAITSVVAQNTGGVIALRDMPAWLVGKQIQAVMDDMPLDAVKVGMMKTAACACMVAEILKSRRQGNVVADPVMAAKDGCLLMEENTVAVYKKKILPICSLLTPNIPEAEKLTGLRIQTQNDMQLAAKSLYEAGAKNVLIKGGHLAGDALDILYDGNEYTLFREKRIDTKNTHGTGCTYSSAIAAYLAMGMDLRAAVAGAKQYITGAIGHALEIGQGNGPLNHFYRESQDF